MTKQDLIIHVSNSTGLSKTASNQVIKAIFDGVTTAIKNKEKVQLIGFGAFEVKRIAARNGINPRTGKPLKIPARNRPRFRPGQVLKQAINF